MPSSKAEWRAELQRRLSQLEAAQPLQQKILQYLLDFMKSQEGLWGLYQAKGAEIPLMDLVQKCPQCQWAFPRVLQPPLLGDSGNKKAGNEKDPAADRQLEFWIPGPGGFEKGPFGILEPITAGAVKCAPAQFQGFIIPGLGFDESALRLGWGKGFYDRFLTQISNSSFLKIGVGYDIQRVSQLPADPWDVRMDLVITDQGIFR